MNSPADERRPASTAPLPPPPPLRTEGKPALFLDFDGTLVGIAAMPDSIEVATALPDLLSRLNEMLSGRLAIVSGRAISQLDQHLGPMGVAMAGSHGGEFRAGNENEVLSFAEPLPREVEIALRDLAASHGDLLVEVKPFGVAIHYRTRPEAGPAILESATALAKAAGMTLKRGKMVVELVMPGSDKGSAVNRFMALPLFAGSCPVFVGDDVTDEDAFAAVLDHKGGGVLVGEERATAALWRLESVVDVHLWLEAALK